MTGHSALEWSRCNKDVSGHADWMMQERAKARPALHEANGRDTRYTYTIKHHPVFSPVNTIQYSARTFPPAKPSENQVTSSILITNRDCPSEHDWELSSIPDMKNVPI